MMLKTMTIAALIAATVGTATLATASFAQNQTAPAADGNGSAIQLQQGQGTGPGNMGPGKGRGMGTGMGRFDAAGRNFDKPGKQMGGQFGAGGMMLSLACSPGGAEALEVAFVRLSYRLDLTADQQTLFDTLRTNALTAQTSFADQCKAVMPPPAAGVPAASPDFLERVKARLTLEQARLDAMNKLLPDIEAFYASLTDTQKADLLPQMPGRGQRPMLGRVQSPADAPQPPVAPAAPDAVAPAVNG